ncbi:NAD(P)H-binding protein [Flavobacteriaceae bacterium]|nr:NAD(P)H-binding protein [Flavobacteriaceae bacterium]MDB4152835.1 NAD(P)H-binding protein [Flavobacteriaceae bacterium]MDC1439125.1 NAD(P)H-binding protein [Flavobacteriaceae bacterium]|tara:strand:- start:10202 stop:10864 length:663 start_codon:yes stop_codon:yes gene_type:complete
MSTKQVTLFGGTGLIGGFLLDLLLADKTISKVRVVTRKPLVKQHDKMEVFEIDFSKPEEIERSIGDSKVVFSCIGTTQAQVRGDKKAYRKIDYDITHNIALGCKTKQVDHFLFVSSAGANSGSSNFYMGLKGEIDDAVLNLKLNATTIFRPSLLLGKRTNFRSGERLAQIIMPLFSFLMPTKLKAIRGERVAKAMFDQSKLKNIGNRVIENKALLLWDEK